MPMTSTKQVTHNRKIAHLGGLAVKSKQPPATCPKCQRAMAGRTWHSYLGHLGLHGLADKYFHGNLVKASRSLKSHQIEKGQF